MATATKFLDFVEQLGLAKHNLNTDTFKVAITNTAPVNTNTVLADLTQISAGTGYTTGGEDSQNTYAESGGTGTMTCTKITWTATGSMGPLRYFTLYNDTQTSPADPLMLFWDYGGSGVTLSSGETIDWRPNNSTTTGTVATIA